MSRLPVSVHPAVLKWARESIKKTPEEVAKAMQTSAKRILDFESGDAQPTFVQLLSLAKIYRRTAAALLLPSVPPDAKPPRAFRKIYGLEEDTYSGDVAVAFRRARWIQEKVAELAQSEFRYPFRRITLESDPAAAAANLREQLGISIADQFKWPGYSSALSEWKQSIEKLGVFIIQQKMPVKEARAFSFVDKKPFVIVLNSSDIDVGRIFSLMHEMAHISLNLSGICNYDDLPSSSVLSVRIEKFCNAFAGNLLVPSDALLAEKKAQSLISLGEPNWDDDMNISLARKFKVSKQVILRRFLDLGYVKNAFYSRKSAQWEREREEQEKIAEKAEIRIPYPVRVVAANGRAYSSFVLEQVYSNRLSYSEASSYLGISSKNMEGVERLLQ